ncbi:MAG: hypothetical protein QM770_15235 [Tepidisphaeraceae bacterium]
MLIDYKTDRISDSAIDARVELYRPQVENYANALAAITGRTVVATYLVFLAPRVLKPVAQAEHSPQPRAAAAPSDR